MSEQPGSLTRQQLYDRIRESSKDEVILEEMIRLGFWPDGEAQPNPPDDLIRRRGEIARALADLHRREAAWRDPEAALKEMHRRRKTAALERRRETKLRNARDRHARAQAWHARREAEILHLGDGVSAGLANADTNADAPGRGPAPGLPPLASPKALAEAMGIGLGELRFLAYDRALSTVSHYRRFTIPKKAGGLRRISAPMPRLKRAQYWILDALLAHVPVHPAAHGFVPGRSIVTNAAAHVGRDVVVNLDLKDFFPSLDYRRIKGKFRGLGYAEPVATVLALLCTEPDVDAVEIDGARLYAARGPRRLPQGAPTSPALTNLVCTRLDARLAGLAGSLGFTYTRYADDLTFSASGEAAGKVGALLKYVHAIVAGEGFTVHPDKTRVMRRGRHQEVTGLTVNERVGVPRETLRRFRALLHGLERHGPAGTEPWRGPSAAPIPRPTGTSWPATRPTPCWPRRARSSPPRTMPEADGDAPPDLPPDLPSDVPSRDPVVAVAGVRADVEGMPHPEHRAEHRPDHRRAAPRPTERYAPGAAPSALRVVPIAGGPILDAQTRVRLGRQMRALYDPVIDEALDPRLAELLLQLDADRGGST
ncbi:reverse transcriptase domain-containing protein [Methylobacterium mesophilicum]|uniref:reverse transcriptase domain-containing protein n=1 Tax=Methylobacterium mesophilicum TaxID=39956 RepID=UPI002F35B83E